MIKKSFTLRVLVISFLLLALPLLIDSFIFFQNSYYNAIDEAKSELRAEANFRAFTLLTLQPVRQSLLRELIYILDLENTIQNPNIEKMNDILREAVHEGGPFHLYILKKESPSHYKIIAASDPQAVGSDFVSYKLLGEIFAKGKGSFIRYSFSEDTQNYTPFLYLVHVVKSKKTGEEIGGIMVVANVESQLTSLTSTSSVLQHVDFAILSPDGITITASDPRLRGKFFAPLSAERRREILETGQIGSGQLATEPLPVIKTRNPPFFEFIFDDQVQIAYRTFLEFGGVSVMSYSAKEAFFGAAVRHFLLIYTIYGLILVAGGGITYWLSLWISRPLRQLEDKMREVGKGNLGVRFKEEPLGFEINILGSMFNSMIDTLLENIQKAEDERVKKETYERELSIGRSVQRSLLPHQLPVVSGAEFAGVYMPADDVGGDFYGFLPKKSEKGEEMLIVSVADAAGRGISTCLYSFSLRSLLRTYATLYDDLGEIVTLSNDAFMQDTAETGMFATLFYGSYLPASKVFNYCCCGHVPGLLRRANGSVEQLSTPGIAIGLKESYTYIPEKIQLASKEMVVLCTDGLIEMENTAGKPFSINRLKGILQGREWSSAQEFVDVMTDEVRKYAGSKQQEEEIIIVAFKVE